MSKLNLKTFSSIKHSKKTKLSNKEVVLKADNKLFGHLILVASSRNLQIREVLKHPLGPLPWSLSNADGTMKKTNKSALARNLEKLSPPAEILPRNSAVIIDGMAIINKLNAEKQTYGELAANIFATIMMNGYGSTRLDVVFDVYKELSIKNAEREKRGNTVSGVQLNTIMPGHKVQQWKSVLRCSASKTALTNFLFNEWQKPEYLNKLEGKSIFVTNQSQCVMLSHGRVSPVPELETSQEEADTRMLLHAKHASRTHNAIIIISEDTDVIVLALAFFRNIGDIYIRCGTRNRTRYIDISKLGSCLGQNICNSLIGLHAFTGCDTVSAFGGKGKVSALKLVMNQEIYQNALSQLGTQWRLSVELFLLLQKFTCDIYASKIDITNVNDLRYQLFRSRKGIESWQLPPCENCLHLHALRANYQASIWRKCLEQHPDIPSPDDHGWAIEDGLLVIKWMTGLPAPEAVLEIIACNCKKECTLPKCECLANGFKCTPACKLQSCDNMVDDQDEDVTIQDEDVYNSSSDDDLEED